MWVERYSMSSRLRKEVLRTPSLSWGGAWVGLDAIHVPSPSIMRVHHVMSVPPAQPTANTFLSQSPDDMIDNDRG